MSKVADNFFKQGVNPHSQYSSGHFEGNISEKWPSNNDDQPVNGGGNVTQPTGPIGNWAQVRIEKWEDPHTVKSKEQSYEKTDTTEQGQEDAFEVMRI